MSAADSTNQVSVSTPVRRLCRGQLRSPRFNCMAERRSRYGRLCAGCRSPPGKSTIWWAEGGEAKARHRPEQRRGDNLPDRLIFRMMHIEHPRSKKRRPFHVAGPAKLVRMVSQYSSTQAAPQAGHSTACSSNISNPPCCCCSFLAQREKVALARPPSRATQLAPSANPASSMTSFPPWVFQATPSLAKIQNLSKNRSILIPGIVKISQQYDAHMSGARRSNTQLDTTFICTLAT